MVALEVCGDKFGARTEARGNEDVILTIEYFVWWMIFI
jgi:hypothetical protein